MGPGCLSSEDPLSELGETHARDSESCKVIPGKQVNEFIRYLEREGDREATYIMPAGQTKWRLAELVGDTFLMVPPSIPAM